MKKIFALIVLIALVIVVSVSFSFDDLVESSEVSEMKKIQKKKEKEKANKEFVAMHDKLVLEEGSKNICQDQAIFDEYINAVFNDFHFHHEVFYEDIPFLANNNILGRSIFLELSEVDLMPFCKEKVDEAVKNFDFKNKEIVIYKDAIKIGNEVAKKVAIARIKYSEEVLLIDQNEKIYTVRMSLSDGRKFNFKSRTEKDAMIVLEMINADKYFKK